MTAKLQTMAEKGKKDGEHEGKLRVTKNTGKILKGYRGGIRDRNSKKREAVFFFCFCFLTATEASQGGKNPSSRSSI